MIRFLNPTLPSLENNELKSSQVDYIKKFENPGISTVSTVAYANSANLLTIVAIVENESAGE